MIGLVDQSITLDVSTFGTEDEIINTVINTIDTQIDAHLCFPSTNVKFNPPFWKKLFGNYYVGKVTIPLECEELALSEPLMDYIGSLVSKHFIQE